MTFLEYALSQTDRPINSLVWWIRSKESGATLTDPDEFREHIKHRSVTPRALQILEAGIAEYERSLKHESD